MLCLVKVNLPVINCTWVCLYSWLWICVDFSLLLSVLIYYDHMKPSPWYCSSKPFHCPCPCSTVSSPSLHSCTWQTQCTPEIQICVLLKSGSRFMMNFLRREVVTLNWMKASKTRSWPKLKVWIPATLFFILCLIFRYFVQKWPNRAMIHEIETITLTKLCVPIWIKHWDVNNPNLPKSWESLLQDKLWGLVAGQARLVVVVDKPKHGWLKGIKILISIIGCSVCQKEPR